MIRIIKILLAIFASLFCLMYALQNLVNLQAAYGFVAAMAGMEGHAAYPNHFGPAINSPALIWIMLWIIIGLELLAGLLSAKGAFDMWRARRTKAEQFNTAKKYALAGTGVGVIIWFGIFSAVGGAYFQMWQTEIGNSVLRDAFGFAVMQGLIFLVIQSIND